MDTLRLGEAVAIVVDVIAVDGLPVMDVYMPERGPALDGLEVDWVGCVTSTGPRRDDGLPVLPSRGLAMGGDDGRDVDGCFIAERRIGIGKRLWVDASLGWMFIVVAISWNYHLTFIYLFATIICGITLVCNPRCPLPHKNSRLSTHRAKRHLSRQRAMIWGRRRMNLRQKSHRLLATFNLPLLPPQAQPHPLPTTPVRPHHLAPSQPVHGRPFSPHNTVLTTSTIPKLVKPPGLTPFSSRHPHLLTWTAHQMPTLTRTIPIP